MNNNEFDNLIKSASEKLGSSPESLRKTIEKKDLNALSSILTKSDKEKLRRGVHFAPWLMLFNQTDETKNKVRYNKQR